MSIDSRILAALPVVIRIVAGAIIWFVLRTGTRKLGNWLERRSPRNLLFAWLQEIGSDVRWMGRGLAWIGAIALPLATISPSLARIAINLGESVIVFGLGLFAVAFLGVWEMWTLDRLDPNLSDKDRSFFRTIIPLCANSIKYIVYFLGVTGLLAAWEFDISPLLGGVAIVGVVLGIAGQTILSEILHGGFIFFERLYYVGSQIEIYLGDGQIIKGTVDRITIRVTFLQDETGAIVSVSNRLINVLRVTKK